MIKMKAKYISTTRIKIDEEITITIDYFLKIDAGTILALTCTSEDHVTCLRMVDNID